MGDASISNSDQSILLTGSADFYKLSFSICPESTDSDVYLEIIGRNSPLFDSVFVLPYKIPIRVGGYYPVTSTPIIIPAEAMMGATGISLRLKGGSLVWNVSATSFDGAIYSLTLEGLRL
ncbi:MAG: hypothetical protein LBV33_07730 [Lachnospiraceae bacterium]|nr:hypothetical protein [Lachnospiraceae bacterium]